MNIPLLGIVADDLTGAMDATGVMAAYGLKSAVALSAGYGQDKRPWDVVCYNTQSRLGPESDAANAVGAATRRLLKLGPRRLYKKIDSTMRGHVGAELTAMVRTSGASRAFVCPAFPDMGRTVMDGVLYVGGRPLTQADEGNDPFSRVDSSSVVELLTQQTGQKVGLVELSEIEPGTPSIQRRISALTNEACRFIVFDATTAPHLESIAEALDGVYPGEIIAGSAGMAAALARRLTPYRKEKPSDPMRPGPSLMVSGSLNKATLRQLERFRDFPGCQLVTISPNNAVLEGETGPNSELIRVASDAQSALEAGLDVGLCWDNPEAIETALGIQENGSTDIRRMVLFIQTMVRELIERANVSCLVLVGGETAYTVLGGLEVRTIEILGEVERGIPVGVILDGLAQGKLVITKAGGFGDEAALVNAISYARKELGA